jgi:site-specific recombinase XerD
MSVKLRGGIYHADVKVLFDDGTVIRKRVTTGFPAGQRDEAIAFERKLRKDIKAGLYSGASGTPLTLRKAFDKALEEYWAKDKSYSTHEINAGVVCELLGGDTLLTEINDKKVWELRVKMLDRKYAPGTINRKLSCLSTLLKLAHGTWHVPLTLPRFDVAREDEPQGRLRYLSVDEEVQGFALLRGRDWDEAADFFTVLVDTGLRLSEGLSLGKTGKTEIDYLSRALRVWESKGDNARSVPLTRRSFDILWHRRGRDRAFDLTKDQAEYRWAWMRSKQGITDAEYVIHSLRHTFASRLVQRGVPLYVVKELMGHESIESTMIYAHLAPENYRAAISVLEAVPQTVTQPALVYHGGANDAQPHSGQTASPSNKRWCEWGDSNSHGFPHWNLNPPRVVEPGDK